MGKLYKNIIKDYEDTYTITTNDSKEGCSIPQFGLITIPRKSKNSDDADDLFILLHEIGHCETFDFQDSPAAKEYKATQWAIDNSKHYKVIISESEKKEWQNYIDSFDKCGNKTKYSLNWSPMN